MTHAIRILAETSDTVTIRRSDFEALVNAAEDAEDLAALAEHDAEETRLGRDTARRDYLTVDEAERLLNGESPVKVWRDKRRLSQRALAKVAGMQPGYLGEIETGRKPGSVDALNRLSTVLGVAMEDLMTRDQRMRQASYGPVLLISSISRLAGDTSTGRRPSDEREFANNEEALDYTRSRWQSLNRNIPYIVDKNTRQLIFRREELPDLVKVTLNETSLQG
jgi:transcriptional regulator with XRE-family HTH domain